MAQTGQAATKQDSLITKARKGENTKKIKFRAFYISGFRDNNSFFLNYKVIVRSESFKIPSSPVSIIEYLNLRFVCHFGACHLKF